MRPIHIKKAIAIGAMALSISSMAYADKLTILHINDHHSHLQADGGMDLVLAGEKTRVRSGGFPALATKIKELKQANEAVLTLHAGDAITGDLYYTLFKGKADAALMNAICFDAFALGNHEFDDGDAGLVSFLDELAKGDCHTQVLAANVKPELGVSPLTKASMTDYFKPHHIFERGGHKIGVIGIDIAKKTKQSSSPDETTFFADEFQTAQAEIDALTAKGVKRIILLTHYQYENDLALAQKLRGVDVIIGGDSHTLLGDFKALGKNASGPYPTIVKGVEGQKVCVAQAWQYAQIAGELSVEFKADGAVQNCHGTPHMMLADSFRRKNADGKRVELTGDARDAVIKDVRAHPSLSIVAEDANTAALLASFSSQVDALKADVIGRISSPLCLERIPGQGKSKMCDVADTAKNGADISNIVAHAFRDMSRTGDIAIQNGGGVRTDVPAGDFSIGDAYKLLPFANTLVELEMTGAEIHQVLEEALDYALSEGGSTGAYPYAAGLRWDIDARQKKGQRFHNIQFKGAQDTSWSALNMKKRYKLITNNYIAGGRDGYLTFKSVSQDGRMVDTYLDYAQSFVDYVSERGVVHKLPLDEYSTQSFKR